MFDNNNNRMIACVTDHIFSLRRLKINHKTHLGKCFVLEIGTVANNSGPLQGTLPLTVALVP